VCIHYPAHQLMTFQIFIMDVFRFVGKSARIYVGYPSWIRSWALGNRGYSRMMIEGCNIDIAIVSSLRNERIFNSIASENIVGHRLITNKPVRFLSLSLTDLLAFCRNSEFVSTLDLQGQMSLSN